MMNMRMSEYLKQAREKAKLSQAEVSEKLNISRQAISRWENGKACPDIENLIQLSELYNVSLDELMKGKTFDDEKAMIKHIKETQTNLLREITIVGAALLTCTIPVVGLALYIALVGYCIKAQIPISNLFKIILAICLLINILNSWTYIRFNILSDPGGKATIEKVAFLKKMLNCRDL